MLQGKEILALVILWFSAVPNLSAENAVEASAAGSRASSAEMETAIRAIVSADPTAALVTVDAHGQPRIRSVDVRPLDHTLTFWVATKPNTRKVKQIQQNSHVALYFDIDAAGSYVSVMGTADLVDDPDVIARISWREESVRQLFWPDFPADYLLIKVTPLRIEAVGAGLEADPDTWRPQSLELPLE